MPVFCHSRVSEGTLDKRSTPAEPERLMALLETYALLNDPTGKKVCELMRHHSFLGVFQKHKTPM